MRITTIVAINTQFARERMEEEKLNSRFLCMSRKADDIINEISCHLINISRYTKPSLGIVDSINFFEVVNFQIQR